MSLNDTPRANRLHIGIFGRRNSGKSSLINALTGQDIALVSEYAGTTTDPVFKSMELHPVGPVVFIDTAGFDDEGALGELRVQRTEDVLVKTDIGIVVLDGSGVLGSGQTWNDVDGDTLQDERNWIRLLEEKKIPVIIAVNKMDLLGDAGDSAEKIVKDAVGQEGSNYPVIAVSAESKSGLEELRKAIQQSVPEDLMRERILGTLVKQDDLVLLVMPQDIQAPKGRLILPQVQTLRELLDRKCTAVATTADGLDRALASLNRAPDLIITDSQCFKTVYEKKPKESALTSFSVLFAAYKGDIDTFIKGASSLDELTENSRVLIAEACTHVPLSEDIGREKIPKMLRKKFGSGMEIVNVCGNDFPDPQLLQDYDLVIHCGACMFNRKHVLSRIAQADAAGVPITNYGVVLAKLTGILDKIEIPGE